MGRIAYLFRDGLGHSVSFYGFFLFQRDGLAAVRSAIVVLLRAAVGSTIVILLGAAVGSTFIIFFGAAVGSTLVVLSAISVLFTTAVLPTVVFSPATAVLSTIVLSSIVPATFVAAPFPCRVGITSIRSVGVFTSVISAALNFHAPFVGV